MKYEWAIDLDGTVQYNYSKAKIHALKVKNIIHFVLLKVFQKRFILLTFKHS